MVRVQLPHQVPVRWAKKVDTIAIWGLLIWRLSGNPRNLVSSLGGCSFGNSLAKNWRLFGAYLGIVWKPLKWMKYLPDERMKGGGVQKGAPEPLDKIQDPKP